MSKNEYDLFRKFAECISPDLHRKKTDGDYYGSPLMTFSIGRDRAYQVDPVAMTIPGYKSEGSTYSLKDLASWCSEADDIIKCDFADKIIRLKFINETFKPRRSVIFFSEALLCIYRSAEPDFYKGIKDYFKIVENERDDVLNKNLSHRIESKLFRRYVEALLAITWAKFTKSNLPFPSSLSITNLTIINPPETDKNLNPRKRVIDSNRAEVLTLDQIKKDYCLMVPEERAIKFLDDNLKGYIAGITDRNTRNFTRKPKNTSLNSDGKAIYIHFDKPPLNRLLHIYRINNNTLSFEADDWHFKFEDGRTLSLLWPSLLLVNLLNHMEKSEQTTVENSVHSPARSSEAEDLSTNEKAEVIARRIVANREREGAFGARRYASSLPSSAGNPDQDSVMTDFHFTPPPNTIDPYRTTNQPTLRPFEKYQGGLCPSWRTTIKIPEDVLIRDCGESFLLLIDAFYSDQNGIKPIPCELIDDYTDSEEQACFDITLDAYLFEQSSTQPEDILDFSLEYSGNSRIGTAQFVLVVFN